MIKAIIADVDGVMVGKQAGVNFPLPHTDVIKALKSIAANGVSIVLCSAKFHVAIDGIIQQAQLNNPHITDGGALIINPLGNQKIIEQNIIDRAVVEEYLAHNNVYTELYSPNAYFIPVDADPELTAKRTQILQMEPVLVDSLEEANAAEDIIKIISFADNEADLPRIEAQIKRLDSKVSYIRSHHSFLVPRWHCVITAPGVSKKHAAKQVADFLDVNLNEVLGIGDLPADWSFMQLCGYAGLIGDNRELRKLALTKGKQVYIGKSVNDHGLLEVFDHFGLITD